MLIDKEKKLIKRTVWGLLITFISFILFGLLYTEYVLSITSALASVLALIIIYQLRKDTLTKNTMFFAVIGCIIYFAVLGHYFSLYFQFVFIYTLIYIFTLFIFNNRQKKILHWIIVFVFAILIFMLREHIYIVKTSFTDDSSYIQLLRVFAYIEMIYFFCIFYLFYKEKNEWPQAIPNPSITEQTIELKEIFDAISRKDNSFMPLFLEYYPDFLNKLAEINPKITKNEIEICALLKLGLTTKEAAIATGASYKAIESSRYRIRRKLNLNSDINLMIFFASI